MPDDIDITLIAIVFFRHPFFIFIRIDFEGAVPRFFHELAVTQIGGTRSKSGRIGAVIDEDGLA